MPPTLIPPIAVKLTPSEYPYQFTEIINFRGDFDQTVRPGEPVNPKGIAYHEGLDRLLVSLSPNAVDLNSRTQILNTVTPDGQRERFASGYQMFRAVESKIAVAPESGPPVAAGFTPGDIFIGRGPTTEISRLSSKGAVIADIFAQFGAGGGFWGGLCFDLEGEFGGRLIAAEANGKIYLVDPDGSSTMFVDLALRLEGIAVAPPTFGPHAKHIIVGVEGYDDDDPHGGEIYAIGPDRAQTVLANIGYAAEDIRFIPPHGGTLYQTQLAFDRERENRLLCVSSSQFLNRLGRMIVNNELTGELWEVAWDAVNSRYTQQGVGRVPGRWTTSGFNAQGTELEAACFVSRDPRVPNWTNWEAVPGGLITDRAPAAATDALGDVVLFSKQQSDQIIYSNSLESVSANRLATIPPDNGDGVLEWRGWRRDPQRIVTPHALSCSLHNARLYSFAVRADGNIIHKYTAPDEDESTIHFWEGVPGGLLTKTSVGSATVNGRLVLCAINEAEKIFLNELAPGGRYWTGWYEIPGGGSTNVTPAVVSFQDELYVLIKGRTSQRILLKSRTADGDWTPWAELPGQGGTESPITAITAEGQLYVFVTGTDQRPYVNIASESGVWSRWLPLPNPVATDAALAPTSVGSRIYLFAKGADDKQVYMRVTI